jgi:hypothetical protein
MVSYTGVRSYKMAEHVSRLCKNCRLSTSLPSLVDEANPKVTIDLKVSKNV